MLLTLPRKVRPVWLHRGTIKNINVAAAGDSSSSCTHRQELLAIVPSVHHQGSRQPASAAKVSWAPAQLRVAQDA